MARRRSSSKRSTSKRSSSKKCDIFGGSGDCFKLPSGFDKDMCMDTKDLCGLEKCFPMNCCNDTAMLKCQLAPELMKLRMEECQAKLDMKIRRMDTINRIKQQACQQQMDCQKRMLQAYSGVIGAVTSVPNLQATSYRNSAGNPLYIRHGVDIPPVADWEQPTFLSSTGPIANAHPYYRRKPAIGGVGVSGGLPPITGAVGSRFTNYNGFEDYDNDDYDGFSGSYY